MCAAGMQHEVIAKVIGIDDKTLRKHYREELDTAAPKANAMVAASLYRKAVSDNHPQAAISAMFWLKCRAGWKDASKLEVGGDQDNPLRTETTHKLDFSDLSDEELQVVREILARRAQQS